MVPQLGDRVLPSLSVRTRRGRVRTGGPVRVPRDDACRMGGADARPGGGARAPRPGCGRRRPEVGVVNLGDLLRDAAEARPGGDAIIFQGHVTTFADLDDRVDLTAAALASLGIGP